MITEGTLKVGDYLIYTGGLPNTNLECDRLYRVVEIGSYAKDVITLRRDKRDFYLTSFEVDKHFLQYKSWIKKLSDEVDELTGVPSKEIDWEERRYEIAKAALQGFCCSTVGKNTPNDIMAQWSVNAADELIEKLKHE